MRRFALVILTLGAILLAAGSWLNNAMRGGQWLVVQGKGSPPHWLMGEWFESEGWLDLEVQIPSPNSWRALVRSDSWLGGCEPVEAHATVDAIIFRCRNQRIGTFVLRRWPLDDGVHILNWHNYWLYKDPTLGWLMQSWHRRLTREARRRGWWGAT